MAKKEEKPEFQPINHAIRDMLARFQLANRFDEAALINSWERIAGKPIAKRTKKLYIRNKVLFVELVSSSMRQDFMLHKAQILELFKKEFGPNLITDIIVM